MSRQGPISNRGNTAVVIIFIFVCLKVLYLCLRYFHVFVFVWLKICQGKVPSPTVATLLLWSLYLCFFFKSQICVFYIFRFVQLNFIFVWLQICQGARSHFQLWQHCCCCDQRICIFWKFYTCVFENFIFVHLNFMFAWPKKCQGKVPSPTMAMLLLRSLYLCLLKVLYLCLWYFTYVNSGIEILLSLQCKILQYKIIWQLPMEVQDFFYLCKIYHPAWIQVDRRNVQQSELWLYRPLYHKTEKHALRCEIILWQISFRVFIEPSRYQHWFNCLFCSYKLKNKIQWWNRQTIAWFRCWTLPSFFFA